MSDVEVDQTPNIRVANEHLHRRIAELEKELAFWRSLYQLADESYRGLSKAVRDALP